MIDLTSKEEVKQRVLRRLIHYYGREDTGRTTHRIVRALSESVAVIGTELKNIGEDWTLTASGDKLDVLAERYGVYRDKDESDEALRERLYTEVLICTSVGSVNHIKQILERVVGIPAEEIEVYLNYSPSLGIDPIDAFIEVSIPIMYLTAPEELNIFQFADEETVPDFDSDSGFDYGRLIFYSSPDYSQQFDEILERIVAAGVGFTVSGRGSFQFADDPVTPDLDSDDGFDAGTLSGVL